MGRCVGVAGYRYELAEEALRTYKIEDDACVQALESFPSIPS